MNINSPYTAKFHKSVKKFLAKHKGERIIGDFHKALQILKQDPYNAPLDIVTLKGSIYMYRLRFSKYRFIYEVIDDTLVIHIVKADKRGDIY